MALLDLLAYRYGGGLKDRNQLMRGAVALWLCGASSASRPLTLLDRYGNLGVQAPKDLFFQPDRHVGVGTNEPAELLDVNGDMDVSGAPPLRLGAAARLGGRGARGGEGGGGHCRASCASLPIIVST